MEWRGDEEVEKWKVRKPLLGAVRQAVNGNTVVPQAEVDEYLQTMKTFQRGYAGEVPSPTVLRAQVLRHGVVRLRGVTALERNCKRTFEVRVRNEFQASSFSFFFLVLFLSIASLSGFITVRAV